MRSFFEAPSTRTFVLLAGLALLFGATPAAAQNGGNGKGYDAPFIEQGLGATNMTATAGNGSLTAGVSSDGDLSVLSWPSPTYYDQLHYITSNAADARQQPRFGAPKRAGAFAGIIVREQGASESTLHWLRDWDRTVTYAREDVRVIETTFVNNDIGLQVVQRDSVATDRDVLVRRYEVNVANPNKYEQIDLVAYQNLTPNLSKVPQVPLLGVLMDHKNDFLGLWDDSENALIQFQPRGDWVVETINNAFGAVDGPLGREFGPVGEELKSQNPPDSTIQMLANSLDDDYAEGVYIATGTTPDPSGYQVGEDQTKFCDALDEIATNIEELTEKFPDRDLPAPPSVVGIVRCEGYDPVQTIRDKESWQYQAEDAFSDVTNDRTLSGNPVAGGQVNSALRIPMVEQTGTSSGSAAVYFGFGETASAATSELNWARNEGAQAIEQGVISNDESFVQSLQIPDEVGQKLEQFIKRAFLNLKVGTDEETGAIVASISRQPSYQLDWPRDGAFFNTALDLAGQNDLVSKRMEFYDDAIRDGPSDAHPVLNTEVPGWPSNGSRTDYPPDSWEMNYYADAVPGGNIRLEIDNSALLVWAYVAHAGFLDSSERETYLDEHWPVIKRATNFIASWRDPETGLMWPANEDDHASFTQGLQGATTSYRALVAAARVAKQRGEDDLADRWLERAGELHAATMHYMADEEHGFVDYEEEGSAAGRAWLAWPTRFLPFDNERLRKTTKDLLDSNLKGVRGKDGNGLYPTKVAISAALAFSEQSERDKSIEIARRLARNIADQKTFTIGETYVPVDDDGDEKTDRFLNAVSTPHLWSAILVYITTVAYYSPERFDPHRDVLPDVEVPDVVPPGVSAGDAGDAGDAGSDVADPGGDPGNGGCFCGVRGDSPVGGGAFLLALVGLVLLRCGPFGAGGPEGRS